MLGLNGSFRVIVFSLLSLLFSALSRCDNVNALDSIAGCNSGRELQGNEA